MKRSVSLKYLMIALLATSAAVYAIDYLISPDLHSTMLYYMLLDLAFLPLSALIVGLIINRLIAVRERQQLLHKMNMVIGAFFTEVGHDLICRLSRFDEALEEDRPHLMFKASWTADDYRVHRDAIKGDNHAMRLDKGDVIALRDALSSHRPFLLGLLQNGNLLEHASFSDMLWAISHLSEELSARRDLDALTPADRRHIEGDMARAFGRLLAEWLLYAHHLQVGYPYLFSFAVRTNPFDPGADIEVQG